MPDQPATGFYRLDRAVVHREVDFVIDPFYQVPPWRVRLAEPPPDPKN